MSQFITVVFRDLPSDDLEKIMAGDSWCALSRDHSLDERDKCIDLLRKIRDGEIEDPDMSAANLMSEMGWN